MSETNGRRRGAPHPDGLRRQALRLRLESGLTGREIADVLSAEHGTRIGASTVAGWLAADARRHTPDRSDLAGEIGTQAAMLLEITGSEIRRLRQRKGAQDVDRIERLARSLKVLEGLKAAAAPGDTSKAKRARTLEALSAEG